jgi:hypothetical protein
MPAVRCPCKSVELEVSGEPVAQFWCHCTDCQQVHGAAYVAEAIYQAGDVQVVKGDTIAFALKTTPRISCAKCGTRLFADLPEIGMRGLSGYLLPAGSFKPQFHLNCAEAVAPVRDGLPHYRAKPASFGGDDALLDW